MSVITYTAKRKLFGAEGVALDLNYLVGGLTVETFTRASVGTFFDAAGVLQTAAVDEPRLDHDPVTGERLGLLIEEARTNLVLHSEAFDNAYWLSPNATVSPDVAAAPDGTVTADKFIEDAVTGFHTIVSDDHAAASVPAASVFVKSAGDDRLVAVSVWRDSGSVQIGIVTMNPDTGAITSGAGTVQDAGNGWFRVSPTVTGVAGADYQIRIGLSLSDGTGNYTGDGASGVFLWGAQLEAGAFPTSYFATAAAAATRAADVCTIDDISGFFNAAEGSCLVELDILGIAAAPRVVNFSDGTTDERINLLFGASSYSLIVSVGGVFQAALGSGQPLVDVVQRVAFGYRVNDFALSAEGEASNTDNSGTLPIVDRLEIGHLGNAQQVNGHVRRILYYPTRLPNAELETLSAQAAELPHSVGESHSIEFTPRQLNAAFPEIVRNQVRALDGTAETLLHRLDETVDANSGRIGEADVPRWEEFLASAAAGEPFTFDEFGSLAAPDAPRPAELMSTRHARQRIGTTRRYIVPFRLRYTE